MVLLVEVAGLVCAQWVLVVGRPGAFGRLSGDLGPLGGIPVA